MQEGFIEPSPWNLAALGFIIALMGWMPAPIEIAAINSLWVTARQRHEPVSYRDGMFDFDVGYITSAVLAIVFLALGVYVQYGNGETLESRKADYTWRSSSACTQTIGEWARPLVGFIAFACMFGTTITVIDGYSRAVADPCAGTRPRILPHTRTVRLDSMDIGLRPGTDFVVQQRPRRIAEIRDDFRLPRRAGIRLAQLLAGQAGQKTQALAGDEFIGDCRADLSGGIRGTVCAELCRDIGLRPNDDNKKSPLCGDFFI